MTGWQFVGDSAVATADGSELRIHPQAPAEGVSVTCAGGLSRRLFTIRCQPEHAYELEELYARESDLVASYRQSDHDQFALQFDWKTLNGLSAVGIEWRLSIRTNLLDVSPAVHCKLSPQIQWQSLPLSDLLDQSAELSERPRVDLQTHAAVVGRFDGCAASLLVSPDALAQASVLLNEQKIPQEIRVFGDFLEKGVIRRARIRLHLHMHPPERPRLQQLYQDFLNSPLPLTA